MWGIRIVLLMALAHACAAAEFSVATYNLHNYLVRPAEGRKAKPEASKAKVFEILATLRADVVALQEVGGSDALEELRRRLSSQGVDYPFRELLPARDPAIQLAVLSRLPIVAVRAHTNDQFLVEGSRQWVRRGLLEVEIETAPSHRLILLVAHLKSKRDVPYARESELRKNEASVLRRRVEAILTVNPAAHLMVAGDLNDTPDSTAVRLVTGRGERALTDSSPPVRSFGDAPASPGENWTHFYKRAAEHSRLDYILLSPALAGNLRPDNSYTVDFPGWFEASDHRPIVVACSVGEP
ncbi:MAG: endonuclease/exonuclease/phosphatase family protein [Verrucomicrobiae bacterium]|jgi:endonuclease/exonuclease/phosphatase family metal-dependent hydrolase|nr:endonuclease/exonuclease/phosphatase family protein [Verrucomicrobiae bacterium]